MAGQELSGFFEARPCRDELKNSVVKVRRKDLESVSVTFLVEQGIGLNIVCVSRTEEYRVYVASIADSDVSTT